MANAPATVHQLPGRLDLAVVRGDRAAVRLTFRDSDGELIDLSGRSLSARLLDLQELPIGGGELTPDVSETAAGVVVVPFPDAATALLLRSSWFEWALRDDSNNRTLVDGRVHVASPGAAGVCDGTTSATVVMTNDTAEVTVTAVVVAGADAGNGQIDGGSPTSNYGATTPIDGGTP